MLGFLSRRDHSPKELRRKLLPHTENPAEIEILLKWATELGYLKEPQTLSDQTARRLNEQMKSHRQIQARLMTQGTPSTAKDQELELKKALVLAKRWKIEDYQKLARRLAYRGFDTQVIFKVIKELKQQLACTNE